MNLLRYPDFIPIETASYFRHSTSVKSLLRQGPIESDAGEFGVYWAARMGHLEVVDMLLGAEISPGVKVVDGQSALIAAVQFNRLNVVERLLQDKGFVSERNGYRVNYAPIGGRTPLSIAAGNGHVELSGNFYNTSKFNPI